MPHENPIPDFSALKVLVVHEWLLTWAGAERQLDEIMRVVPHADLVIGAVSDRMRTEHAVARRARETWLANLPMARRHHRWWIPLQYPAFASIDTRGYDLVISSSAGFGKAVRQTPGRPHLCYCYSPPRYLWDLRDTYREQEGGVTGAALRVASPLLRALDRVSARSVTRFVGISNFVAERIRRAYGVDAGVVYPAVTPKPVMRAARREDFLLVLGRLVAYKRVDLAIDAAEQLGIPLVVAGVGPELERLRARAGRNTTFVGEVDEPTAGDLMERCRAFVFCAEEDFGIAPIEANAHGAPVIGLRRGALRETMRDSTAEFFDEPTVPVLRAAIERAVARRWDEATLRSNATRFSPASFRNAFAVELSDVLR